MENKLGNLVETGVASRQEIVMPTPVSEKSPSDSHSLPEKMPDPGAQSALAASLATTPASVAGPVPTTVHGAVPVINSSVEFDPSWVVRMRSILNKVRNNPKGKVEALDKLKAEYKKSRFSHDSPVREGKSGKTS